MRVYLRRGARPPAGICAVSQQPGGVWGAVCEGQFASMILTCVIKNANICVTKNAMEADMRSSTYDKMEEVYRKFKDI